MIAVQHANPSTLVDVLEQVKQAFSNMGDATPIEVGKQFLAQGIGAPPRIIFAPEMGPNGAIGDPREAGNAASMVHSCMVSVRARGSQKDTERFKAAYALAFRVISCLVVAGTGRIAWVGGLSDTSPSATDSAGAELTFYFTYSCDIPHDAKRWALAPATADTSDEQPQPPPGVLADGGSITLNTVPIS